MAKSSIKIGKKDYPYRLDFRAIRMAEQLLGNDAGILDRGLWSRVTYWMTVLWAGINREDSTVSYTDIEKAVDKAIEREENTFSQIQEFVMREINNSGAVSGFGTDDEEEDTDPLASASKSTSD